MENSLKEFLESMIESKAYDNGYILTDITIKDCDGFSFISGECEYVEMNEANEDVYKTADFVFTDEAEFKLNVEEAKENDFFENWFGYNPNEALADVFNIRKENK